MLTRDDIIKALTTDYDVEPGSIRDTDTDEALGGALNAAYRATPSDHAYDARGRAAALRQAGTNAANLHLSMSRHAAAGATRS